MDLDVSFQTIWNRDWDFQFTRGGPKRCSFAQGFFEWTNQLFANASENKSTVFVNQSKVLLLDKYFEWRAFVPKSHRNCIGNSGHICIFQVFAEAYERLKVLELSLTPPMLFLPPAPLPPQAPQPAAQHIAGIFIGEDES